MRPLPLWARVYVVCAAPGAAVCAAPVRSTHAPWGAVARFALIAHHTPVLLAGACSLPPSAAALVALPGPLLARVEQRQRWPRWPRRIWRAARLAVSVRAASRVDEALGGRDAVVASDFPYALGPAGAAALVVFCLALTALDGGILAPAERIPARGARRGLFPRSLARIPSRGSPCTGSPG